MLRKSFLIQMKEGKQREYERRHNPIWPELEAVFKENGVSNFSIFMDETTGFLFGYLEVKDEASYNRIGETEVCRKWWKYNTEVLKCESENSIKGIEVSLREVFHMD